MGKAPILGGSVFDNTSETPGPSKRQRLGLRWLADARALEGQRLSYYLIGKPRNQAVLTKVTPFRQIDL